MLPCSARRAHRSAVVPRVPSSLRRSPDIRIRQKDIAVNLSKTYAYRGATLGLSATAAQCFFHSGVTEKVMELAQCNSSLFFCAANLSLTAVTPLLLTLHLPKERTILRHKAWLAFTMALGFSLSPLATGGALIGGPLSGVVAYNLSMSAITRYADWNRFPSLMANSTVGFIAASAIIHSEEGLYPYLFLTYVCGHAIELPSLIKKAASQSDYDPLKKAFFI